MPRPTFDKSNGWWYILVRDAGRVRHKKPLGKDPRWKRPGQKFTSPPDDIEAIGRRYAEAALQAKHGIAIPGLRTKPLAEVLDEYRTAFRLSGKARNSTRLVDWLFPKFLAYCSGRGLRDVAAVGRLVCRDYLEDGARAGLTRRTLAQRKALLSPAFDRAVAAGLIAANPWQGLAVPGQPGMKEAPHWSEAEVTAITAALVGLARVLFLVGVNSGFRINGLLNVCWKDVRWQDPKYPAGSLACRVAKGDRPYRIPLFPVLRAVLTTYKAECSRTGPEDFLFPSPLDHTRPMSLSRAQDWIRKGLTKAGVEDRGRPCHMMRDTFGTLCAARNVNPRVLMQWMNHSNLRQTSKYLHYDKDIEASEVAKLGGGGADTPALPEE